MKYVIVLVLFFCDSIELQASFYEGEKFLKCSAHRSVNSEMIRINCENRLFSYELNDIGFRTEKATPWEAVLISKTKARLETIKFQFVRSTSVSSDAATTKNKEEEIESTRFNFKFNKDAKLVKVYYRKKFKASFEMP